MMIGSVLILIDLSIVDVINVSVVSRVHVLSSSLKTIISANPASTIQQIEVRT